MSVVRRAVIIGGGIGGLCSAIGLRQAGVEAIVYEQAERLNPVGAGLTLWANAIRALRRLGLADAAIAAGSSITRGAIRTARGRILSQSEPGELERLFGEPTIAIHRADLHQILLSALPPESIRLGARCVGFEQDDGKLTVHFANGVSDQADLLIGTDGLHSVIRERLFPHIDLRYSGYTAWRGVVATTDESALGVTTETWGCGARFGILRIDRERVYWFATQNTPAGVKQNASERKAFLQHRFAGWHHPVGFLIEATPADEILHNDIYDLAPMKVWGQGRAILLGDAAHPTTPNMGQGACMAIESSVVLARCLSEQRTLPDALRRYQTERMPRTAWITEQSWRIGRIGQLENRFACMIRNFVVRMIPETLMRKALARSVSEASC